MKFLALAFLAVPLLSMAAQPSMKEVSRIRIGGEARWDYLEIDSSGHRLFVSHGSATEVIDTQSGRVIGQIPDTPGVHGIALAPDLGLGFISDGKADAVTVFELATLKTVSKIAVGANPDAIVYDPASHHVLTFNGRSKDVTLIDAAARKVLLTTPVGGKPEFARMGKDGKVGFNIEDTGELAVIDPRTGALLRRQSLAPCVSPSGLAIDDRFRTYSVCENKLMVVADAQGKMIGRAPIGAGADGVAWLDGAAYGANGQDGTVSVVRESKPGQFETVETIPTAHGARTIVADPATHRLYLPTADLAPAAPGSRPAGIPGSFYVLVLEKAP
jgi:DNA-binding beta-propeller fold protein YncE